MISLKTVGTHDSNPFRPKKQSTDELLQEAMAMACRADGAEIGHDHPSWVEPGKACPKCGDTIVMNRLHRCRRPTTDERIAVALERIAEAIERMEK